MSKQIFDPAFIVAKKADLSADAKRNAFFKSIRRNIKKVIDDKARCGLKHAVFYVPPIYVNEFDSTVLQELLGHGYMLLSGKNIFRADREYYISWE